MKINIVINEPIRLASGGYKIIYQYANFLAQNNHRVTIYHRCRKDVLYSNYRIPFPLKTTIAKYCMTKGVNWFEVDRRVKCKIITKITDQSISDGDAVIATAVDTANEVNGLSLSKGKKIYFIQHFEDWVVDEFKVRETYSLGMTNIVVAKWLKVIVDRESKTESVYIPNGIDKNIFFVKKPIESREPTSVAALYHSQVWKGSKDAIQVLKRVRKLHDKLHVEMFGISEKPDNLPEWITYTKSATQDQLMEIYNNSAIFLCTSWSEGFGLTGAESMFCGCALVTTDTLGVREYADEKNSLICKPRDIDALTNAVCKLIDDSELRIKMAKIGHDSVTRHLDYSQACQSFEQVIRECETGVNFPTKFDGVVINEENRDYNVV